MQAMCKRFVSGTILLFSSMFLPLFAISTNQELFNNKNILILGGTGFLGKALVTEILKYNPRKIIIYSRDEVKHFSITTAFGANPKIINVLGDIRDYESLLRATKDVDIVFHAAALKRIDMLEDNVEESIKTNIVGSLNVFNACIANNVTQAIFISTDKACSPVNTYGACKFISEKIFTNYNQTHIATKFVVARYGNVLDSTGSAIPIFTKKIKNGEEIPLTDERMTRFIISKEQAIELLFDALRYGSGGEVFIKRLPAMKIIDLIDILKEKLGASNPIKVIGLRPGEKIDEDLLNQTEMSRTIVFDDYFIIRPSVTEQFIENKKDTPAYIKRGVSIGSETTCYTSAQAVITKDELLELFKTLKVL